MLLNYINYDETSILVIQLVKKANLNVQAETRLSLQIEMEPGASILYLSAC